MEDWVGVIGLNLLNVLSLRHHTLKVNVCNNGPYSGHEINLRIVYILCRSWVLCLLSVQCGL